MSLSHDHAAEVNSNLIDDLRAENARLQERVEEAERKWNLAVGDRDACLSELAKAEALAERRKEALGDMGDNPDCLQCRDNKERAHAAIEEEGK